jgi:lysophospholipase L1-like esterase
MVRTLPRLLACAAIAGIAACSSSSSVPGLSTGTNIPGAGATGLFARFVGVGDSLTAGVQSGALLGATLNPNPLGAASLFPIVPNTQGKGWYARVWSQANGGADPLDPSKSPLPLMAPPGIGQILLPATAGGLTSIVADVCAQEGAAYSRSTALTLRINPNATPLDVAVPGQMVHEALYSYQPTSGCADPANAALGPLAGLASLIGSENLNFYPVLANFGGNVTQIQAAASLRPTLATVWLGSNDLLKFAIGNGGFPPTDPAALGADITKETQTLQGAGAKVAVFNLFDVLQAPYFTPITAIPALITQTLISGGTLPGPAATEGAALGAQVQGFLQATYGLGNQGYLTLSGVGKLKGALTAILGGAPALTALSSPAAALVAGDFVSDAIAVKTQQLNDAYNAAIAASATATGAALIDTHTFFTNYTSANALHYIPLTGNPACCALQYGGGLTSLDGLHPSDTGYALIANLAIAKLNASFAAGIPALTDAQITAINAADLYSPH